MWKVSKIANIVYKLLFIELIFDLYDVSKLVLVKYFKYLRGVQTITEYPTKRII